MAYNRWISPYYLEHHQVLGAHWGVHNGPPYPLDRSKSNGHRLLKGTGAPQGKKKNRVSENSVRRRTSTQGRSDATDIESAKKKLAELGVDKAGRDEFELWAQEIPEKDRAKWMQDMIDETATKARTDNRSDEEILKTFQRSDSYGGMYDKDISNGSSKPVNVFMFDDPPEQMKKKLELVREIERDVPKMEKHVKSTAYDKKVKELLRRWADREVSKEEFDKDFRLRSIFVTESEVELVFFDNGKYFGYHDLCVEYDPKTKRVSSSHLQG